MHLATTIDFQGTFVSFSGSIYMSLDSSKHPKAKKPSSPWTMGRATASDLVFLEKAYSTCNQWDFRGPPIMGPLSPIPLPCSNPWRYGKNLWETYHPLGIQLFPGITLDLRFPESDGLHWISWLNQPIWSENSKDRSEDSNIWIATTPEYWHHFGELRHGICIPETGWSSIFGRHNLQKKKRRPFQIKTRVIWVPGAK